jgi:hypothetical protein
MWLAIARAFRQLHRLQAFLASTSDVASSNACSFHLLLQCVRTWTVRSASGPDTFQRFIPVSGIATTLPRLLAL